MDKTNETVIAIKAPVGRFFKGLNQTVSADLIRETVDDLGNMAQDAGDKLEDFRVMTSRQIGRLNDMVDWDKTGLMPEDIPIALLDFKANVTDLFLQDMPQVPTEGRRLIVGITGIGGFGLDFTITFYGDLLEDEKRPEGEKKGKAYATIHAGSKTLVGMVVGSTVTDVLMGGVGAMIGTRHAPVKGATKIVVAGAGVVAGVSAANMSDRQLKEFADWMTQEQLHAVEAGNVSIRIIDPKTKDEGLIKLQKQPDGSVQTTITPQGNVQVKEHTRDGHKVRAHERTRPDGEPGNNFSAR